MYTKSGKSQGSAGSSVPISTINVRGFLSPKEGMSIVMSIVHLRMHGFHGFHKQGFLEGALILPVAFLSTAETFASSRHGGISTAGCGSRMS
eukprot:5702722-Amphidinium_carterae.1